MAGAVDEAAELLYGLPLDEFTTARNAAAKELRDLGLGAEADEVKALAKPSVAAWAVNRLTRRRHAELEAFLKAATGARDALEALVRAAREELGGPVSEAIGARIRQTLEAAAVDDGAAEDIRRGRLVKELEPAGFGTLAAHASPSRGKRRAPTPDAAATR